AQALRDHNVSLSVSQWDTMFFLRQAHVPAFIAQRKHRISQIITKYRTVEENIERVKPPKNRTSLRQAQATTIRGFER
ncbi:hypothetical protein, partial [Flavobacterium sp.]|uniref:hypothetical protein n=1 Tax=Flavobacterium sp. TaxID=239 RepID=UPI0026207535